MRRLVRQLLPSAKNAAVLIFFAALWLSFAWRRAPTVGVAPVAETPAVAPGTAATIAAPFALPWKWHRFASWPGSASAAGLRVPGVDDRRFAQALRRTQPAMAKFQDWGYALRFALGQMPAVLLVTDSTWDKGRSDLALREEVADEFAGANIADVYQRAAENIARHYARYQSNSGARIWTLIVPTKLYALQMNVRPGQLASTDRAMVALDANSPRLGSALQTQAQQQLRARGVRLLNTLPATQSAMRQHPRDLFPHGESHWTPLLRVEIARDVLPRLVTEANLPAACVGDLQRHPRYAAEDYFGDFFDMLQMNPSDDGAQRFRSRRLLPTLTPASPLIQCPPLTLVGTSFGNADRGRFDFAQALAFFYRGEVRNLSVPGRGALFPMDEALKKGQLRDAIVIWEFPFRVVRSFVTPVAN